MYRSGLDWSGDPGDVQRSGSSARLIVVVATLNDADIPLLDDALVSARRDRRLPDNYAFKYSGSRPPIRESYFHRLRSVPFLAHALIIEKRTWDAEYLRRTVGQDRINEAVVRVVLECPEAIVARQVLLVDASNAETRVVGSIRDAIRAALSAAGRRSFGKVKPCADDRTDGKLIQIADMIAGALNDPEEIRRSLLSGFTGRLIVLPD